MVVVVILGMMSGLAMVSWSSMFPNQQFNTAVRRLSDVLHATRSEAIARSHAFRIYYDLDNDSYRIRTPYREGGGFALVEDDMIFVDEVSLAPMGIDLVEVTMDDKAFDDGEVYVEFDALGASSYHRVILRHGPEGREFTIEALSLTGDIRFHEGVFKREMATEKDFD